jgi:predicted GNAT family acetyltransferase
MHSIVNRGELAFLHVYGDNPAAAALYAKLGFTQSRSFAVTVLRRSRM